MRRLVIALAVAFFAPGTVGTLGTILFGTQGTVGTIGTSANAGEWTHYGGNAASQKYSPLDQINKDNVGRLAIAWRWASPDNLDLVIGPVSEPRSTTRSQDHQI
ncbi:MAG: hypothetical protein Q7R30_17090 [Acidobacteriota bacterium]|nr:hypothetical protein [Acidobacteriota bacterium]